MAFQTHRSSGNSRGRTRTPPMSEINVTPMVDVMLVLLIVFMVTAPLLTVGVQIDLPKAKILQGQDEPLAITIDAQGQIYLQDTEIDIEGLVPRLRAITDNNPDVRIFVRGDASVNYGRVMEVMGTVNAAGYKKVALVTQQQKKRRRKKKSRR